MGISKPIVGVKDQADGAGETAPPSAMRMRFSWLAELAGRFLFSQVVMNETAVAKIRELDEKGTVVYVLRHRSFVDYFLLNYVLRREDLPLPVFANGVSSTLLAPAKELLSRLRWRLSPRRMFDNQGPGAHQDCARALSAGKPVLIFMRGRRKGGMLGGWPRRPGQARVGSDFLREIVHSHRSGTSEKFIIPLALFRGHSFRRRQTGLSAVVYSAQDAPGDVRKLVTYWVNRKDIFFTVGKEVVLGQFMDRYGSEIEDRLVRRLVRAIQIFLHREERVVLGPALLPRRQIKALVLENEEMATGIRRLAEERQVSVGKLRKEADGYFEEMAANFNGVVFGIVAHVFRKVWNRMFSGLEPVGFEAVIEKVRHHPVVLVPCHRSHFDYLTLSYLFYLNFVSPPHIAAGINMAFWPMGPVFRAAGAFFIRRSFADNELYKLVFKQYLTFLIREGYTQEFFIEGGRSRTGKMLTPRLGMLSAIVNAYLSDARRDLYLAPVSIHYGRIVEEAVYGRELRGASKEAESIRGLLKARHFLKQKFGTVYLSFGEPISLGEALGENRKRFSENAGDPEVEEEKRKFVQKFGFRILRAVNDASPAGATSISATVLLGATHAGRPYRDYASQANALAELALSEGVKPTASLERNLGDFRESLSFLSSSGLIEVVKRSGEEVLVVPESKRLALDFYKNNLIHTFLVPSLVTTALLGGVPETALAVDVAWGLNLLRYEFPLPERDLLEDLITRLLCHYRERGALRDGRVDVSHPLMRATAGVLDNFYESYFVVLRSIEGELPAEGMSEKQFLETTTKHFETSLLLGEVSKQEASTTETFKNAISRFAELRYITVEGRGRGGREKWLQRGPEHAMVGELAARLSGRVSAALIRGRQ